VQAVPRSSHILLLPVLLLSRHEGSQYAAGCTDHRARHINSKHAAGLLLLMRGKDACGRRPANLSFGDTVFRRPSASINEAAIKSSASFSGVMPQRRSVHHREVKSGFLLS